MTADGVPLTPEEDAQEHTPGVVLYTGSWEEWSNQPDTPKTTSGEP